ncbi:MAG: tetratricopeptide repeat protein [Candidatus Brocadiia bacterium]
MEKVAKAWAIACFLFIASFLLVLLADDDVAKAFLTKGDEAMKKGDTARALELYQKAAKESPGMPEAHFKCGEAYNKSGEKVKSRASFKKCIALVSETTLATPAMKEFKKKAEDQLVNLDVSRKEGRVIEQEYIKELINFTKKTRTRDNYLTEKAIKTVLAVDPSNAEAQKMIDEIKAGAIFQRWEPILTDPDMSGWDALGERADWKSGKENEITISTNDSVMISRNKTILENNYAFSLDFKIEKDLARSYGIGLILGIRRTVNLMPLFIFSQNDLRLCRVPPNSSKPEDVKWDKLPDFYKRFDWNNLRAEVENGALKVYINDKLAMEYKSPDKTVFNGEIGLWAQNCNATFANLKYQKR